MSSPVFTITVPSDGRLESDLEYIESNLEMWIPGGTMQTRVINIPGSLVDDGPVEVAIVVTAALAVRDLWRGFFEELGKEMATGTRLGIMRLFARSSSLEAVKGRDVTLRIDSGPVSLHFYGALPDAEFAARLIQASSPDTSSMLGLISEDGYGIGYFWDEERRTWYSPTPALKVEQLSEGKFDASQGRQFPTRAETWTKRGWQLVNEGHSYEALLAFENAIQIRSTLIEAWWGKACVHYWMEEFEQCLKICEKLLTKYDRSLVYVKMGLALKWLERFPESLQAFDKSLQIDPNNSYAWNQKGKCLALPKVGRYEESLMAFNRALDLRPDFVETWGNIGVSLANLAQDDDEILEAKKWLCKAWSERQIMRDGLLSLDQNWADRWQARIVESLQMLGETVESCDEATWDPQT